MLHIKCQDFSWKKKKSKCHLLQLFFFFFFFFFWFGFYGPFKNISLISSRSFIEGGRKPEYPEKNHLTIRKQNLAFPHMTRARLEPQRWETLWIKSQLSYPLGYGGPPAAVVIGAFRVKYLDKQVWANSVDPDQKHQKVVSVSDQVLHCHSTSNF